MGNFVGFETIGLWLIRFYWENVTWNQIQTIDAFEMISNAIKSIVKIENNDDPLFHCVSFLLYIIFFKSLDCILYYIIIYKKRYSNV